MREERRYVRMRAEGEVLSVEVRLGPDDDMVVRREPVEVAPGVRLVVNPAGEVVAVQVDGATHVHAYGEVLREEEGASESVQRAMRRSGRA